MSPLQSLKILSNISRSFSSDLVPEKKNGFGISCLGERGGVVGLCAGLLAAVGLGG